MDTRNLLKDKNPASDGVATGSIAIERGIKPYAVNNRTFHTYG